LDLQDRVRDVVGGAEPSPSFQSHESFGTSYTLDSTTATFTVVSAGEVRHQATLDELSRQ